MKVLARIPLMPPAAAPQPPAGAAAGSLEPVMPTARPRSTALRRSRPHRPRFPAVSVVALAGVAALAWSLATWNDARRAERSRLERLARMDAPAAAVETMAR